MTYEQFKESVLVFLSDHLGKKVIEEFSAIKNNNTHFDGVRIFRTDSSSFSIYLNDYFELLQDQTTFEMVCTRILEDLKLASSVLPTDFPMDIFGDYDLVKGRFILKLINIEKNKDLLKEVPYVPWHDLAIVFMCLLGDEVSRITLIYNRYLTMWNVTLWDVYACAISDAPTLMPFVFRDVASVVENSGNCDASLYLDGIDLNKPIDSDIPSMYFLSNCRALYGASCVCYPGLLEKISYTLGGSFFILPSSIHEVIIISNFRKDSSKSLQTMVREINSSKVSAEDFLSDNVYYYDSITKTVEIVL